MTPDEVRWLTWGAIHHRPAHAPKWDEPGTAKAIADHCGTWALETATAHVLAHARDPKARTPFAIKGNAPHTEAEKAAHRPPKRADECAKHPGQWLAGCSGCAADQIANRCAEHECHPPLIDGPGHEWACDCGREWTSWDDLSHLPAVVVKHLRPGVWGWRAVK